MANEPGYVYNPGNQSAAETARLKSNTQNESQAESNRLASKEKTLYAAKVGGGRGLAQVQQADGGLADKGVYMHSPENIVANGKDTTGKIPLNLKFDPNMLDGYDTVTYHWKFFIASPEASTTGQVFNTAQQTIIAETGVSDLTIDKVEIESIATPTVETGTGTSTQVKFEILEPAGAGLIDKIFYQSLAMGIGNWNVMPFYLQLQFKGRNPDTSEADDGQPGWIGNLKWLWPLKLTSIAANVTTMGTRYEFVAIPYNQLAQSNAYFSMQHTTTLQNLDTFGDAMEKLQDALNEDQIFKLIDNNGIPDSYRIIVDSDLAKYKVTPVNSNTDSTRAGSTVEFIGKNATFPASTSVDKMIDGLLANVPEIQTGLIGSQTPGAEGLPMNAEKSQMKTFWRITTETRPIKFDPRRQDYAREFTIFVFKYDIGIMDSNTFQSSAPPVTSAAERKRLATYAQKSILKKKYNYIYTGLNDQIINFDIKINNAFASAMSRMGGIYFNAAMKDMGTVAQQHAEVEGEVTSKFRKHIALMNTSESGGNAFKTEAARKEFQNSTENAKQTPETKSSLNKLLLNAKSESKLNFIRSLQADGGLYPTGFIAKDLATPRNDKVTSSNLRFISDVDQSGDSAKQAYAEYVKLLKGTLRPIARIDSMHQNQVGAGVESSSNSGIQKLSSMFAVALHSNLDGSYAQITMTIKGDPFWLFPKPYTDDSSRIFTSLKDPAVAIKELKSAQLLKNARSANLYGTDNFIILRFRTPKIYDIENNANGENNVADVETFSGVFKVINVKHFFEKGVFKQELYCQLDPQLNILNFTEEIEADAGTKGIIPPIVDISADQIPEQFSKTSRLENLGGSDIRAAREPVPGVSDVNYDSRVVRPGGDSDQNFDSRRHGLPKTSNVPVGRNFTVPGTRGIVG